MKYTSKQEALNNGFCKKNGIIYKKSLLEIWYSKNWLELSNSKYTAEDRLKSGTKLAEDFVLFNRANLHSSHVFNVKVDCNTKTNGSVVANDSKRRYLEAMRIIPAEFWPIVRKICIEEIAPELPECMSKRQKIYFNYLCRIDLCRGLDRLVDYYNQKLKVNKNNN